MVSEQDGTEDLQSVDELEAEWREHTDTDYPRLRAYVTWLVGWMMRRVGEGGRQFSLEDVDEADESDTPTWRDLASPLAFAGWLFVSYAILEGLTAPKFSTLLVAGFGLAILLVESSRGNRVNIFRGPEDV